MENQNNQPFINLEKVVCPKCQTEQKPIRIPTEISEAISGGWTCPNCGCKMDRYGKEISGKK